MTNRKSTKEMKDFVGQYFLRACKNHDLYKVFKESFHRVRASRGDRNPFGQFNNYREMLVCMSNFTNNESSRHHSSEDNYQKVTMMINHMLHFFLEKGGVDPRRLGAIGQEIFDLSCYGLYGDQYLIDMENMHNKQEEEPHLNNEKEAWLYAQFLKMKSKNLIPSEARWEDFRNIYIRNEEMRDSLHNNNEDEEWIEDTEPF